MTNQITNQSEQIKILTKTLKYYAKVHKEDLYFLAQGFVARQVLAELKIQPEPQPEQQPTFCKCSTCTAIHKAHK